MKKALLFWLVLALLPSVGYAQPATPPSSIFRILWANRPLAPGPGTVRTFTDTDCDGNASTEYTCQWNGSQWINLPVTAGSAVEADTPQSTFDRIANGDVAVRVNETKPWRFRGTGGGTENDGADVQVNSLGVFEFLPVCNDNVNECDRIPNIPTGFKYEWQINSVPVATLESTGLTNLTLNAEGTGNAITMPEESWFEVAACQNATPSLIFNANTANSPAPICEGTNTRLATADFDDATDEGFEGSWRLPTGFTGAIDAIFRWKGAATSGAVGWCLQLVRVPTGATSDPALPAQAAGNCVSSTVAGTTLQEVEATISGVTCTSCVAGDRINWKLTRDAGGSAVTDSFVGDAKLLGFVRRWRATK